jgi:hypothetical protein
VPRTSASKNRTPSAVGGRQEKTPSQAGKHERGVVFHQPFGLEDVFMSACSIPIGTEAVKAAPGISSDNHVAGRIGAPARTWHNELPPWIRADPAFRKLRQGPRQTLQVIANRCDAPPDRSAALLVCFGGKGLAEACGCDWRTLRRHIQTLKALGFVVDLSRGGGRLANIYGVPGFKGELAPFQCDGERRGTGPGRRWLRGDTTVLREELLVGQNALLEEREPGQNDTAGRAKCPTSRDKLTPQLGQNALVPSSLPSPLTKPNQQQAPTDDETEASHAIDRDDAAAAGDRPDGEKNLTATSKALLDAGVQRARLSANVTLDDLAAKVGTPQRVARFVQAATAQARNGNIIGLMIHMILAGDDPPPTAAEKATQAHSELQLQAAEDERRKQDEQAQVAKGPARTAGVEKFKAALEGAASAAGGAA